MKYKDLGVVEEIGCGEMSSVTGGAKDLTWGAVLKADDFAGVGFANCPKIQCIEAATGTTNLGQALSQAIHNPDHGAPGNDAAWYQATAQQLCGP